ncbi:MAG: zinc ribbon domain-containing protein [Erysipelotrichaceae bacterium]|nr:zinc ribbon domain-containing protein [Erysipelotrichaceae bacterium]
MNYCSYCGSVVSDDARYCSNCGKPVNKTVVETLSTVNEPLDLDEGYRVVLFSKGTCTKSVAKEVLMDLLGYSSSTVLDLLNQVPVEIADELNYNQATVIAQALAEYGMEVTIVDEDDKYISVATNKLSSVFDSTGALVAGALATLATLTAANRVHRYRKYRKPSLLSMLFKPLYKPAPLRHIRRTVSRDPEPARRIRIENRPNVNSRMAHQPVNNRPQRNKPAGEPRDNKGRGRK